MRRTLTATVLALTVIGGLPQAAHAHTVTPVRYAAAACALDATPGNFNPCVTLDTTQVVDGGHHAPSATQRADSDDEEGDLATR